MMQWEEHKAIPLEGLHKNEGIIDIYIANDDLHHYVVLAERKDNPGASVTNAYEKYAFQVCKRFSIDHQRCIFFELYVQPTYKQKQLSRKYELDICTPTFNNDSSASSITWKPTQPEMKKEVLSTLVSQVELTDSYDIPLSKYDPKVT